MGNMRKYRTSKLVTTERRRNYLVSEPNFHTTEFFTENLLATEMRKTQISINKPDYLNLSKLDLSKIVIYEFWYHYVKPKYGGNTKLCNIDMDSFIVYVKRDDIKEDLTLQILT